MIKFSNAFLFILFLYYGCTPQYVVLDDRGYEKTKVKDYDGAFRDFNLSIQENDKFWLAYSNRGACYMVQENYPKAVEDFNKSISLYNKGYLAYDNRALCKLILGDTLGALSDFRLALNNKNKMAYTHLGTLLTQMDSCNQALVYLNMAMKKNAYDECNTEQDIKQLIKRCQK